MQSRSTEKYLTFLNAQLQWQVVCIGLKETEWTIDWDLKLIIRLSQIKQSLDSCIVAALGMQAHTTTLVRFWCKILIICNLCKMQWDHTGSLSSYRSLMSQSDLIASYTNCILIKCCIKVAWSALFRLTKFIFRSFSTKSYHMHHVTNLCTL